MSLCLVTTRRRPTRGEEMGTQARVGLLLGAAACLLAVMVDWVVEELNGASA
jgi:hypothetical protein